MHRNISLTIALAVALLVGADVGGVAAVQVDATYDPQQVDWAGVVSACHAAARYEARLVSLMLRSVAHDALSIDVTSTECMGKLGTDQWNNAVCGGFDASLFLCEEERQRPENGGGGGHAAFAKRAAVLAANISNTFGASMSDVLAVCGMAMPAALGGGNLLTRAPLRVGRLDSTACAPKGQLPPDNTATAELMEFFKGRNLSVDDGMSLLGAHALVPAKGCVTAYAGERTVQCNPERPASPRVPGRPSGCPFSQLHMFKFNHQWFLDLAAPRFTIFAPAPKPTVASLSAEDYTAQLKQTACGYTSTAFKDAARVQLERARDGSAPLPATETAGAAWPNVASCAERPSWLPAEAPIPCPHPNRFFFPRADAFLAKSTHEPVTEVDKEVQSAVAEYAASNEDWLNSFARAYVRMVDLGAKWSQQAFYPTWVECPRSRYAAPRPPTPRPPRGRQIPQPPPVDCTSCMTLPPLRTVAPAEPQSVPPPGWSCPQACVCSSAYAPTAVLPVDASM